MANSIFRITIIRPHKFDIFTALRRRFVKAKDYKRYDYKGVKKLLITMIKNKKNKKITQNLFFIK